MSTQLYAAAAMAFKSQAEAQRAQTPTSSSSTASLSIFNDPLAGGSSQPKYLLSADVAQTPPAVFLTQLSARVQQSRDDMDRNHDALMQEYQHLDDPIINPPPPPPPLIVQPLQSQSLPPPPPPPTNMVTDVHTLPIMSFYDIPNSSEVLQLTRVRRSNIQSRLSNLGLVTQLTINSPSQLSIGLVTNVAPAGTVPLKNVTDGDYDDDDDVDEEEEDDDEYDEEEEESMNTTTTTTTAAKALKRPSRKPRPPVPKIVNKSSQAEPLPFPYNQTLGRLKQIKPHDISPGFNKKHKCVVLAPIQVKYLARNCKYLTLVPGSDEMVQSLRQNPKAKDLMPYTLEISPEATDNAIMLTFRVLRKFHKTEYISTVQRAVVEARLQQQQQQQQQQ
jgi:hypothetical protein